MHNSKSGKTFGTHNPSTKEKIADVQEEDNADVDLAVKVKLENQFYELKVFMIGRLRCLQTWL
jgi:acyl-CoA reductase-like NAD-dependent aldehyde dehydrogenase